MTGAQHFYQPSSEDGSPATPELLAAVHRAGSRNQLPQMIHAHPYGLDCNTGCHGYLIPPPPPTRWSSLMTAIRTELAPR